MKRMIEGADKSALEDIRAGGERGMAALYKRYSPDLQCRIRSRYGILEPQEIQELCDDTFYAFYSSIHNFRGECSVYTWLCHLLDYRIKQYFAKTSTVTCRFDPYALEEEFEELQAISRIEREVCYERCYQLLLKRIQNLPRLTANFWRMKVLAALGKSTAEISNDLGKTPGSVRAFMSQHTQCWQILTKLAQGVPIVEIAADQQKTSEEVERQLIDCRSRLRIYDQIQNCQHDCEDL